MRPDIEGLGEIVERAALIVATLPPTSASGNPLRVGIDPRLLSALVTYTLGLESELREYEQDALRRARETAAVLP